MYVEDGRTEPKHYFIVAAVLIALSSPLIILLVPALVSDMRFASSTTWFIQTPAIVHKLYTAAVAVWCLCMVLFYFSRKKMMWMVNLILFALSTIVLVYSTNTYKYLSDEEIVFHDLFGSETQVYSWGEVDKIESILSKEGERYGKIRFTFNDGKSLEVMQDNEFRTDYGKLLGKIGEHSIPYVSGN